MKGMMLSVVLLGLFSSAAGDMTNDVRCREIAFSQSAETRDLAAFRSFLDADARFVGNGVRHGPDEIAAAWQDFFTDDGPEIAWRPKFVEVLEDGTMALTRGPYRMRSKDADGNVVERWGTFNSVWRVNPDGQWRVVFDAGNAAAKAPDEETQALLSEEVDC